MGPTTNTLYAEYQRGQLDAAIIDFSSPSHHLFFNVSNDAWQMNNLYYSIDGNRSLTYDKTLTRLHDQLWSWLACKGPSCP